MWRTVLVVIPPGALGSHRLRSPNPSALATPIGTDPRTAESAIEGVRMASFITRTKHTETLFCSPSCARVEGFTSGKRITPDEYSQYDHGHECPSCGETFEEFEGEL